MSETDRLRPAEQSEVAYALSFALRFDGRKQFRHASEFAAQITAEHLMRHLHEAGFRIMKIPPARQHTASDYGPPPPGYLPGER